MTLKHCFYLLIIPVLAAAQTPARAGEEALRNNREILAVQKKIRRRAPAPRASQRPARAHCLAGLRLQRRSLPRSRHRLRAHANAGVMISQEMPFPGKQKLRGEVAPLGGPHAPEVHIRQAGHRARLRH